MAARAVSGRPPAGGGAAALRHPGPPAAERVQTLGFPPIPVAGTLRAGFSVEAELDRLCASHGCFGAVITLADAGLEPIRYLGPALSEDPEHAVWYSPLQAPEGPARLRRGIAVVGWQDEARMVHCHGFWDSAAHPAGTCGHLLCDQSILAAPMAVRGVGSAEASFCKRPDPETNFPLFEPVGDERPGGAFYLRVRPHEDLCDAVSAACERRGFARADIFGLGSLNGVRLTTGEGLSGPATEFFIEDGAFAHGRTQITVCAVDAGWRTVGGVLALGRNPICVTAELLVVKRG